MSKPLVLLADDDRDTVEAYEALFGARGCATAAATDGGAALAAAIKLRPAVILLDISLPVMDGLEVLRRLRAHPECGGIPVVVVTGHAFPHEVEAARRHGATVVLTKPCEPEELCRTVLLLVDAEGTAAPVPDGKTRHSRIRSSKPRRRASAAGGQDARDLTSLLLWSDFLIRHASGLRLDAAALTAEAARLRTLCVQARLERRWRTVSAAGA
jgi:CheY-like chemotaxis protein